MTQKQTMHNIEDTQPEPQQLLTISQAAKASGRSYDTIRKAIAAGELIAVHEICKDRHGHDREMILVDRDELGKLFPTAEQADAAYQRWLFDEVAKAPRFSALRRLQILEVFYPEIKLSRDARQAADEANRRANELRRKAEEMLEQAQREQDTGAGESAPK